MIATLLPVLIDKNAWPIVIFLMLFSLGLAIFYTLFIGYFLENMAKIEIKPSWLFFALLPAIVGICGAINPSWAAYALIALVGLLFTFVIALSVLTFLLKSILSIRQYYADKKSGQLKNKASQPLWKKTLALIVIILLITAFFQGVHLFFIVFIAIIFFSILAPSQKSAFLRLQANLPTSKIRSMAMGLIELRGKVLMGEPMQAPIEEKNCIGYRYTIEDISRDDDGDDHYSMIEDKTFCNRFTIDDGTGHVEVNADGISFVWVALDSAYRSNNKRYSQYLLLDGDDIFLVGNASLEKNTPVIELDPLQNILCLSPAGSVERWNTYKPLLNAFIVCNAFIALCIAAALITPISIKSNQVILHFEDMFSSWENFDIQNEDEIAAADAEVSTDATATESAEETEISDAAKEIDQD
jgi:ABC-type multidrug transport system fused ATPase/permease subunit